MPLMRRPFAVVVAALALTTQVWAAGPPFQLSVKNPHTFGGSRGTLAVDARGIEYQTTDAKDARKWTYDQIKEIQVLSPTRIAIRTYEDRSWVTLWADRTFTFEVLKDRVTPELVAFLLSQTPRPVVTVVLPPETDQPLFRLPVKHLLGWHGSSGTLLLYKDGLAYRGNQIDDNRHWRFGDVASAFLVNRYRLEVTVYEGGGGDTRLFNFQLMEDPPPGFFDALWAGVNPPLPWADGTPPLQRKPGTKCCADHPAPAGVASQRPHVGGQGDGSR